MNMRARKPNIFLTLTVIIYISAVSCSDRPDNVLSEKETVDLLADLQLAEAYYSSNVQGASIDLSQLEENVLSSHGVSQEEFATTMAYYGRNMDKYAELYDKVNLNIRKKSEKLNGSAMEINTGDDMWPYNRFTYFNLKNASNGLRFSIPTNDMDAGERIEWKLNLNSAEGIEGMVGVEYTDGSATYNKRNAAGNRNFTLNLQTDTGKVIKRIFGVLNMPERSLPVWADSIQLLRLPYDSMEYSKIRIQNRIYPLKRKSELETPKDLKDTLTNDI